MNITYQTAVERAQWALFKWEQVIKTYPASNRHVEIGSGHAANLRGTIRNSSAPVDCITSLTDDLSFRISKLA